MSENDSYWDGVASRYDELYQNEWSAFENSLLRSDLERLLAKTTGRRVLDIGCGTGLGYELLKHAYPNIEYVGLDSSPEMLSEFSKRHPDVKTIQESGDAFTCSSLPYSFDLVISINVAASFPPDTEAMLRNIFNALAPGGLFYLSFLNRFSLRRLTLLKLKQKEQYRTRGDKDCQDFVIAKAFSRNEIIRMCASTGFDGVKCHYRSVLGGVWESAYLMPLERVLMNIVPWLGHSITATGTRINDVRG